MCFGVRITGLPDLCEILSGNCTHLIQQLLCSSVASYLWLKRPYKLRRRYKKRSCPCPRHIGIFGGGVEELDVRHQMEVSGQHHAPAALLPGKTPGIHWTWGWVYPRVGLYVLNKKQISHLPRFELRTFQSIAYPLYGLRTNYDAFLVGYWHKRCQNPPAWSKHNSRCMWHWTNR